MEVIDPAEPFVKWAGGKRLLLPLMLPHFPSIHGSGRYFEPFLGGGAAFFALRPRHATLSDILPDLIEAFEVVRSDVDALVLGLRRLTYSENEYYRIRASQPRTSVTRAARFIYLNKTCFNGLYRVNLQGKFNVPVGAHGRGLIVCDERQLRSASAALRDVKLVASDFEEAVEAAKAGDFVYFDPPYTTSHRNNGFIEYNANIFSWTDQRRLAAVVTQLATRGVNVAVTNANHPSIQRLYPLSTGFIRTRISRWSTISASASRRIETSEFLVIGGPHAEVINGSSSSQRRP